MFGVRCRLRCGNLLDASGIEKKGLTMMHKRSALLCSALLCSALLCWLLVTSAPARADYAYQSQFGSAGSGNGQFEDVNGVAVDGSGNVFVADAGNNRIEVFAPSASVPEPSSLVMLGLGSVVAVGLGFRRMRRLRILVVPALVVTIGLSRADAQEEFKTGLSDGGFTVPAGGGDPFERKADNGGTITAIKSKFGVGMDSVVSVRGCMRVCLGGILGFDPQVSPSSPNPPRPCRPKTCPASAA